MFESCDHFWLKMRKMLFQHVWQIAACHVPLCFSWLYMVQDPPKCLGVVFFWCRHRVSQKTNTACFYEVLGQSQTSLFESIAPSDSDGIVVFCQLSTCLGKDLSNNIQNDIIIRWVVTILCILKYNHVSLFRIAGHVFTYIHVYIHVYIAYMRYVSFGETHSAARVPYETTSQTTFERHPNAVWIHFIIHTHIII